MTSTTTNDGTNSRGGRPITGEACFRANGYGVRITLAGKRTTIRLSALGRTETPEATTRAGRYRDVIATLARDGRALPHATLEPLARSLAALPETRLDAAREVMELLLGARRPANELAAVLGGIVSAPSDDAARAAVRLARLAADGRAALPQDAPSADWITPGLSPDRAALLAPSPGTTPGTFGHVAELWMAGKLAAAFPGRVRAKQSHAADRPALAHVLPVLAKVPVRGFTLDHGEAALSAIPTRIGPTYRARIAMTVRQLLSYAVFPLRWAKENPLPPRWVPQGRSKLERQILMPREEHAVLACRAIPVWLRVFMAWQARQGTRYADASRLTLASITFQGERATITLCKTKDRDPRSWALDADDTAMIRAWLTYRRKQGEQLGPTSPLFVGANGGPLSGSNLAETIRVAIWDAGIRRASLFTRTEHSWPHEEHDLRALFCTYSLAKGRPLSWITDRTGHTLDALEGYQRPSRRWAETELGDLAPSVRAIPELAALVGLAPLPPPRLVRNPGDMTERPHTAMTWRQKVSAQASQRQQPRRHAGSHKPAKAQEKEKTPAEARGRRGPGTRAPASGVTHDGRPTHRRATTSLLNDLGCFCNTVASSRSLDAPRLSFQDAGAMRTPRSSEVKRYAAMAARMATSCAAKSLVAPRRGTAHRTRVDRRPNRDA
ncbi:tyrosine-type recombinase/integrase [Polyangium jinanense]|uniref:Site-specific integrase n=1 Tax=Polyangium jinanense TaxID=2829994 RepID=A0A9X3X1R4_9BACT|nr:tyrosine-type recombinase/integrase [Polyangium jinanense]MDC3979801.1 site-specific integrase [Polyangium jinanense]